MSEDAPKSPVSLVSSFRAADYIYSFTNALDDPLDGNERATVLNKFRAVAAVTRIKDYKLLEERNEISIYLRTPEDLNRFNIARASGDQIEQEFVQFDEDYDFRKIKRAGRHLQKLSDQAGFGDTILFGVSRKMRSVLIFGSPKAYFAFADYVQANQSKFQKFFDLQRDEPEFDLPTPTEDEAVEPNIIVYDENPIEELPASDLFIRGGATNETATPPTGKLSLVASYDQDVFKFKLDMTLGFNPELNGADKLSRHDPTYFEFKVLHGIPRRIQQIHTAMQKAAVDDYFVYSEDNKIQGRFKRPQDLAVAVAAISPDSSYLVDFVQCSQNASPMKMNKKAKTLQAIFAEHAPNLGVQFVCDMARNVICVKTGNSEDFIRTQGVARKLETTNPVFQRIVGLS